jgi:hypothetical protein
MYFRAQVGNLGAATVVRAVLRLTVSTSSSADSVAGGRIQRITSCGWDASAVTFANQPLDGTPGADVDRVKLGAPVDFDVTAAVQAGRDGVYCFAVTSSSSNRATYRSSEAVTGRPQLIVQVAP